MSKGEGHERRIEVFKTDSKPHKDNEDINELNSVASNSLSSDVNRTEVSSFTNVKDTDVIPSQIEEHILSVVDTDTPLLDENISRLQQPCEDAVDTTTDISEHVGLNDLTETAAIRDTTHPTLPMLCCSNCGQQVPQSNYRLHALRCKTPTAMSSSKKSKDMSLNKVNCLVSSHNNSDNYIQT